MKVLISNPGSTSYKCKLYEPSSKEILNRADCIVFTIAYASRNLPLFRREILPGFENAGINNNSRWRKIVGNSFGLKTYKSLNTDYFT